MMPSPLRSWSLRCWPALALPLLPDLAQAQVDLSWTDGVLGSAVNFSIDAAPTAPLGVLLPSFNVGPTPLSLLDPFDPRVLGVGLDLFAFAAVVPLDPLGDATVSFPLPANPALAGTALLAQAITLPGTQTLVDGVSNRVSFVLAQPGDSHPALGDDVLARRWATTIPLDDGSVLVAGGLVPRGAAGTPGFAATDRVSRFDPETQTYSELSAGLPRAFGRSRSVTMADGRTLIAGGLDANGATATCVVYDPASGQFTQVGSMQQPRVFHTLNALPDGRVLAAGGSSAFTPGHPIGHPAATAQFVASTELFNPSSGTWSAGPLLPVRTTMHEAATLAGGRVLLTGGISQTATALQPETTDEAYFFLPVSNQITPAPPLPEPRMHHGSGPTELGSMLVAGGSSIDFVTFQTTVHDEAWVFDQTLNAWTGIPDVPALIRCGQLTCVENGVKVYYLFGMGLTALDLATGATTYDKDFYTLDSSFTVWRKDTTSIQEHQGGSFVPIDDGVRVLLVGPGEAPGFSGSPDPQPAQNAEVHVTSRPDC